MQNPSRSELCRALGVSRSGLYDHEAKAQRPRWLQDMRRSKIEDEDEYD